MTLEEVRKKIAELTEELKKLRYEEAVLEDRLQRERVLEHIKRYAEGDPKRIKEVLDMDIPVCIECGIGCCDHFYNGARVRVKEDGSLEVEDWYDEELVCRNDPDHDVVLPSWFDLTIGDFGEGSGQ